MKMKNNLIKKWKNQWSEEKKIINIKTWFNWMLFRLQIQLKPLKKIVKSIKNVLKKMQLITKKKNKKQNNVFKSFKKKGKLFIHLPCMSTQFCMSQLLKLKNRFVSSWADLIENSISNYQVHSISNCWSRCYYCPPALPNALIKIKIINLKVFYSRHFCFSQLRLLFTIATPCDCDLKQIGFEWKEN